MSKSTKKAKNNNRKSAPGWVDTPGGGFEITFTGTNKTSTGVQVLLQRANLEQIRFDADALVGVCDSLLNTASSLVATNPNQALEYLVSANIIMFAAIDGTKIVVPAPGTPTN